MFARRDGGLASSGGPSAGVLIIMQTDGAGTPPALVVGSEEAALILSRNSLCFHLFFEANGV